MNSQARMVMICLSRSFRRSEMRHLERPLACWSGVESISDLACTAVKNETRITMQCESLVPIFLVPAPASSFARKHSTLGSMSFQALKIRSPARWIQVLLNSNNSRANHVIWIFRASDGYLQMAIRLHGRNPVSRAFPRVFVGGFL